MNTAYLLIGGNIGDRVANLADARMAIEELCGLVTATSHIYETEAWGLERQPHFLNQALEVQTHLTPANLLQTILKIEKTLGRTRSEKYGPRLIDIDILLYNDAIIKQEGLVVPHPQLHNRRFALQCLNDVAADKKHPVLEQTVFELLKACPDPLKVNKFS